MELLKKSEEKIGYRSIVDDPELCNFIKFGLVTLPKGRSYEAETAGDETCLVILAGKCTVSAGEEKWDNIGSRSNVFEGNPYSVYLPKDYSFEVVASTDCSIAICRSPAKTKRVPRLIPPEDVKCRMSGKWNWSRKVCDIMGNDSDIPENLIIGETFNPPGNWSSAPPHKHDVDNLPEESKLEEVYFYKLQPRQGFGVQRVYTEEGDIDEAYVIEDGDAVAIPKGYHPVVAGPGYQLYYLWVLAGETRMMAPNDDPEHAWLKNCEPIISQIR